MLLWHKLTRRKIKIMLDPIADMLTRIRNAQRAGHATVSVPFSKLKLGIAKILKDQGFIASVSEDRSGKFAALKLTLGYESSSNTRRIPVISGIRRVSRQGQRVYVKRSDIRRVKNGYGISIVSTSKGLMTGEAARKSGLGGEIVCEVW